MAMSMAPCFIDLTRASGGRRTVSTMSASFTASASVRDDVGAGGLVLLVGEMRAKPGAGTHPHLGPELDELLRRLGAQPDARLLGAFGGHANGDHRCSVCA